MPARSPTTDANTRTHRIIAPPIAGLYPLLYLKPWPMNSGLWQPHHGGCHQGSYGASSLQPWDRLRNHPAVMANQLVYLRPAPPTHCLPVRSLLRSVQRTKEVPVAREQRKLAAILAADVVGYYRLMGATRAAQARFRSTPEQRKHLFQDRTNAKSRPGPEGSAVGTNAKCRPRPETSDVRGKADLMDRRSER
jgi:hypothetical protein